jgi:TRAP-type mannitol/chloroaromatic compound transport system permease small subunit
MSSDLHSSDLPRRGPVGRLSRLIDAADLGLTVLACLSVLAIMVIVGADVLCRYALNAPVPWAYDLISLFLINAILYFPLSEALRTRHHVSLGLQFPASWDRSVRVVSVLGWVLVLAVLLLFAWVMVSSTLASFIAGERVAGRYEWIVWVKLAIVAVGAVMVSLRVALMLLAGQNLRPSPKVASE